jgi:hypothetical protein
VRIWLAFSMALAAVHGCNTGSPVSRSLGAQCDTSADCDDICLAPPDYPDGFCTSSCDTSRACPGPAACVGMGQGVCLFECEQAADCEFLGPGWTCAAQSRHPEGGEVMVCVGG